MVPRLICLCLAGFLSQSQNHLLYHCLKQWLRLLKHLATEQAWKHCLASP